MTDDVNAPKNSLWEWSCNECGSPLMATKSGSVCPNGHGRLKGRMPTAVKKINHALILGIQPVTNKLGHYYLADGQEVELVKQINREVKPHEIATAAIEGRKIWKVQLKSDHTDG